MEVFGMLNPIRRSATRADVQRYKVEPYVVAADVYGEAPHEGRGGWTWYTGSAGWLYRAGLEWILGFRLRENQLTLAPCVPPEWPGFTTILHPTGHRGTPYEITRRTRRSRMVSRNSPSTAGRKARAATSGPGHRRGDSPRASWPGWRAPPAMRRRPRTAPRRGRSAGQ